MVRGVGLLRLDGAVLSIVGIEAGVDVGLLEGGVVEQLTGTEALAEEEVQVDTLDTVGGKVGRGVGTTRSNANLENAQLVELHGLALQEQLTQAVLHLHEDATDGALGEHAVMVGHVGDELLERDALVGGSPVILHVALGRLLVLVLVLFVTDHGSEKFRVVWHYYRRKGSKKVCLCTGWMVIRSVIASCCRLLTVKSPCYSPKSSKFVA